MPETSLSPLLPALLLALVLALLLALLLGLLLLLALLLARLLLLLLEGPGYTCLDAVVVRYCWTASLRPKRHKNTRPVAAHPDTNIGMLPWALKVLGLSTSLEPLKLPGLNVRWRVQSRS